MSSPSPPITKRRVPPPCWNPDETLVLVKAYADKWLSLNRGYLRSSDWDAVASAVSASNPTAPKSSLQCRHKIEKLRIRYRSEKQRCLALPGRFVSSWHLFPLLDSMNFGSSSGVSNQGHDTWNPKSTDVGIVNNKNLISKYRKVDGDLDLDFDLKDGLERNYKNMEFDDDFGVNLINDGNLVNLSSMANDDCGSGVNLPCDRNYMSQGVRLKSYRKIDDDKSSRVPNFDCNIDGFPVRSLGDRILASPPALKSKDIYRYYDHDADYEGNNGSGSGFCVKASDKGFVRRGIRLKNYDRIEVNCNDNVDFRLVNGYGSSSRLNFGKKNDGGGGGVKRVSDPFEELVSSITLLTERFVKMEEMKVEMAMETQKIRMEMEMKHSQMILESQRHILDTFLTGLLEKKKKKKVKVGLVLPNGTRNGDEV